MAKFNVVGLDDVQEAMLRRDKATMEAVPEMLKAGGEVIKNAFSSGNEEVKQHRQRNRRFNRVDQGIRSKRTQRREIRRYCADGYRSARGTQCRKRLRAELRAFKYARATVVHGGERKSGGRSDGRNAPRLGGKAK